VDWINRRPITGGETEAQYSVHATCLPENVSAVRDLLDETLDAHKYPIRDVTTDAQGADQVELAAELLPTSAEEADLDSVVADLLRSPLSRLRQLDQRIRVRFALATDSHRRGMSGRSPVSANNDQRAALTALAGSRDRGEADRARAILLTLSGWTSPRIAEAFGVREDTVRLWRSDFSRGGTDALKASVAPGPPAVKSEAALRVVAPLLEEPVANRPNWTIARMRAEIEAREGVSISRSQLSKALRKKSSVTGGRGTR
jgi:transposase